MNYLMWFDDSKLPMSEKAKKALDYYLSKFGLPAQILETSLQDEKVEDARRVSIPKFHFLMGRE